LGVLLFSLAVMNRFYLAGKLITRTVVLTWLLVLTACHEKLAADHYVAWIQDYDHGLHVKREYADFVFDLQFQPRDFFKLTGTQPAPHSDQGTVMQYYLLRVSCKDPSQDPAKYNVSSASEWQQRLYYYSYLFQKDLFLEENGLKYPCVLFHFEQSDISNTRVFTLGFETPAPGAGVSNILVESEQFGSLPVRIEIVKENIPALKI